MHDFVTLGKRVRQAHLLHDSIDLRTAKGVAEGYIGGKEYMGKRQVLFTCSQRKPSIYSRVFARGVAKQLQSIKTKEVDRRDPR